MTPVGRAIVTTSVIAGGGAGVGAWFLRSQLAKNEKVSWDAEKVLWQRAWDAEKVSFQRACDAEKVSTVSESEKVVGLLY